MSRSVQLPDPDATKEISAARENKLNDEEHRLLQHVPLHILDQGCQAWLLGTTVATTTNYKHQGIAKVPREYQQY